ncbi:MAG: hypothetical protein ACW99U_01890 [Candidatus Thorarchaeota archaeon]
MLRVLEERSEIAEVQDRFEKELNNNKGIRGTILVGYQGGSSELEVTWNQELGIWWGFGKAKNRYWNAFGTEEPEWNSTYTQRITCEINPPFEGISRYAQGVYARDQEGSHCILHRGKIGGGRPGIGKELFISKFYGERIDIRDGDRISRIALVAVLGSPRLAKQVATFVHEVDRIKLESTETTPSVDADFTEEFFGTKAVSIGSRKIVAKCDHGIVVNELAKQLEKRGMAVRNNQYVDLFVVEKNNTVKIAFEIKTSAISTQYYEAIGQLFFHSAKLKTKPHFVAVFPEEIDMGAGRVFGEIGIHCLTYKWDGDRPIFNRLPRLIHKWYPK